jgi:flagellar basal-body rod protein FlgG
MQAMYTAKTGVEAQQYRIDAISHNLANANTTGYKRTRVEFADLFYRVLKPAGQTALGTNQVPHGIQLGTGVRVQSTVRNFTEGALEETGRPLDLAVLQGKGFFKVQLFDGTFGYTRAGAFELNADGEIVDGNGNRLEPAITIPQNGTDINVSASGVVSVQLPGQTTRTDVGQLEISTFVNDGGLLAKGDNVFVETIQSGAPSDGVPGEDSRGMIAQKYLESSNVQLVEEMVAMITGQRAYEINSNVISTSDQMMQTIGRLKA